MAFSMDKLRVLFRITPWTDAMQMRTRQLRKRLLANRTMPLLLVKFPQFQPLRWPLTFILLQSRVDIPANCKQYLRVAV